MNVTANRKPVLQLRGIRKSFGRTVALSGVDIDVYPGEVHAVVGENGAGKSTLINVAAGVLRATEGVILVDGKEVASPDPVTMRNLGLSVAYQHPALPAHLSVLECLALVEPSFARTGGTDRARALIHSISPKSLAMDPHARVGDLTLGQKHVAEIARALASNPRVLVLDEPTEPFKEEDVRSLFAIIATLKARGIAIVYISHRLGEVTEIADTISVLRDGELIASRACADLNHDEIVSLIVGKSMGQVFPLKQKARNETGAVLSVAELSGRGFTEVSFDLMPGEILGLAGVEGQGQREFIRALAGLNTIRSGDVRSEGRLIDCSSRALAQADGIRFVPDDRHSEGLFLSLSVQDNLGLGNLGGVTRNGVINAASERELAETAVRDFSIKTPSLSASVSSLSGGNQQKVLIAREILAGPRVLLIDEPTKGVDIGSKSEVYHQLRHLASQGVGVIVASSDGVELEGLCDRVVVFSRGQISAVLVGEAVNDESITAANLASSNQRSHIDEGNTFGSSWSRLVNHDYFPIAMLVLISFVISLLAYNANNNFVSINNLKLFLTFLSILGLISFAQLAVMLLGEIDFSLGPLAGFVVVIASFWIPDKASTASMIGGAFGILAVTTAIGLLHGLLIIWLRLPSIVVTLASFFGLQGLSLFFRPLPHGSIAYELSKAFSFNVVVVPSATLLLILICVMLEWTTFRTAIGRGIRAIGSDWPASFKLGQNRDLAILLAFGAAGLLTGLGGLMLAGQVGFGSPTTGISYSLMSITAVVLGGAIISGGRGSFVATLFGAVMVQANSSATSFLKLGTEWQYWLVGLSTLLGAGFFAYARRTSLHR